MRKLIGYVAGAAFGIAFVATCGSSMKGNDQGDMGGFFGDGSLLDIAGAGADGPGGGGPQYTSGSRIKQKTMTSSDGASGFVGWYDSQLSVDCYFNMAADQQMRCIPTSNGGGVTGYFSDANCSQPIGEVSSGCPSSFVYTNTLLPSCVMVAGAPQFYANHVYAVGAAYSGSFYTKTGTGCPMAATNPTPPTGYEFRSLTEAPPTMFASATFSIQ